ncbi:MAG: MBL fold metallo-hydrolase [Deltaproteobacteria bacterium]|nr:MBL fold metallo-hydrolase [Deltaproteobacteria bacterium]
MRFSALASGSGGNAFYVEMARTRVLVDAGLSCRELIRRMEILNVDPATLDALVITHEHLDHIRGAGPLARRLGIPVFINGSTLSRGRRVLGNISTPISLHTGQSMEIKDVCIETFTKCHDAADPIGLVLSAQGQRLGLITDLGRSTRLVEDRLRDCQALILEFNHDERMLEEGPYPLHLKRRIRGPDGHLSNRQAGELLRSVCHQDLRVVILAHLSETNNLPQKAYEEAKRALAAGGGNRPRILVSNQKEPLSLVEL